MATKKRKRFNEGGITEAEDKARGLESSKADKVGFLERLRMGNIDDEGSEAYRRFGAGRAKSDRDMASEAAAMRLVDESRASPAKESARESAKEEVKDSVVNSLLAAGAAEGMRKGSGDASVAEMYSGPRTKSIERTPPAKSKPASAKTSAYPMTKAQPTTKTSAYPMTKAQPTTKTYDRTGGPTADELASYRSKKPLVDQIPRDKGPRSLADQIPGNIPDTGNPSPPVKGEKIEPMSDAERNIKNMVMGLGPGRLAGAVRLSAEAARAGRVQDAYNKAATAKRTAEMRAKGDATKFASKAKATDKNPTKKTKKFDDAESNIEFKRGGMVSSASKRADGIATKGKTRCKMR